MIMHGNKYLQVATPLTLRAMILFKLFANYANYFLRIFQTIFSSCALLRQKKLMKCDFRRTKSDYIHRSRNHKKRILTIYYE